MAHFNKTNALPNMSLDGIKKVGSKLKKSKPTLNFNFFLKKNQVLGYHEKLSGTNAFNFLKTTKKGRTLSIILKEDDDEEQEKRSGSGSGFRVVYCVEFRLNSYL